MSKFVRVREYRFDYTVEEDNTKGYKIISLDYVVIPATAIEKVFVSECGKDFVVFVSANMRRYYTGDTYPTKADATNAMYAWVSIYLNGGGTSIGN